jgi:hypothetical protein
MSVQEWLSGARQALAIMSDSDLPGVAMAFVVAVLVGWRLLNISLRLLHQESALTLSRDAFSRFTRYLRF